MSARSPRGSLSGGSDIAGDFEDSLRDLARNDKYEISNLTLVAKECTENAQAISRALENHIRTTAPARKLPALYVLDSIVKNVGTPYTVYLGRNLYTTFMSAYTLVDNMTRRSMEAMLKTWKEPVPGSVDTMPVFSPDVVRPIENALIKARTAMLQNRPQAQQQAIRSTPTPPQLNGQFAPPPGSGYPQYYQYSNQQHYTSPQVHQHSLIGLESTRHNTAALISRIQSLFAANPLDQGIRTQLQALLQLQHILQTQNLGQTELQQIAAQVSQLSAAAPVPNPTPQQTAPSQWSPPTNQTYVPQLPTPLVQPLPTPSFQQQLHQQHQIPTFAPGALNGLQALLANNGRPTTPQIRSAAPALQSASHAQLNAVQNQAAAAPSPLVGADLIAALAKNNLLPTQPHRPLINEPSALPSNPTPRITDSTAALLQSLQGVLPPVAKTGSVLAASNALPARSGRATISAIALKEFHPELIFGLYDALPNQCNTCGRRFLATPEGRAMKDRHLDWHFRTNQRLADPNTGRGQHRNWFYDEIDWIHMTDFDPSTTTVADATANANNNSVTKKQQAIEERFVRAPAGMTKNTCSICFEDMKSSYSEELQDWVFTNAVVYNKKIVHATCAEEIKKSAIPTSASSLATALASAQTNQRGRSATPDSSLGKRKAENVLMSGGPRVKVE
nr:uncharacterized protein c4g9.04c [Quercus suber]